MLVMCITGCFIELWVTPFAGRGKAAFRNYAPLHDIAMGKIKIHDQQRENSGSQDVRILQRRGRNETAELR